MRPRSRPRVFVVAAAIVVAAAAVVSLTQSDARTDRRSQPRFVADAPVVLPAGAEPQRRSLATWRSTRASRRLPATEDLPARAQPSPRARRGRRRIRAAAETFVAALLRWGTGKGGRGSIRAVATPELARFVLSARPRVPLRARRPPEGRIARVEVVRAGSVRALAQLIVRRRGAPESILLVELVRREGRWLAAALR
jgi:hypothetical protein